MSKVICLIFTSTALFASKKPYRDWREAQDDFADYKASLGPWPSEEVAEYLAMEYKKLTVPASVQIEEFLQSTDLVRQIQIN